MATFRTPDERFAALPGYPFTPHDREWHGRRLHHLDEGTSDDADQSPLGRTSTLA